MPNPLFLDTTICIDRAFGDPEVRPLLNRALSDYKELAISSVVLRELFRTIVRDLVELEDELRAWAAELSRRGSPISHLLRALVRDKARSKRERSLRRKIYLIADLLDDLEANFPLRADAAKSANRDLELIWLFDGLHDLQHKALRSFEWLTPDRRILLRWNPELEPKDTAHVLYGPVSAGQGLTFVAPAFPHGAGPFLDQRREGVIAVYRAVEELPEARRPTGLLRVIDWARDEASGPPNFTAWLPGKKENPWYLADMLIVMDTPEGAKIASKDRAFRILCPTLGRELIPLSELLAAGAAAKD